MITAFFAKWGMKLLFVLGAVATALGLTKMYGKVKKRQGASEEREKTRGKVDEKIRKARRATDNLRANPSERERLRNRRTRD